MLHRPSRRLRAATFLACGLGWLVLSWPWLSGRYTIPYDTKAHFHAQLQFLANALHSGQSPFWNPNVFGGSPQIADPQSLIFSPAVLIALANPQPTIGVIDWYALGLLACAAFAIIAFCLDQRWHPIGAATAGLSFAFGSSASWRVQHVGQIQSYALFALALWLLARALDRRSPAWALAAGLAAGMMVVEPDQIAMLGCYLLAGYCAAHFLRQENRWHALYRLLPTFSVASASAIVLSIVPIVLTYLFVEGSNRPSVPLEEAGLGSLHPASLLTAVIGDLYGALDPKVSYWGPQSMSWDPSNLTLNPNMSQVYTGIIPVLLLATHGIFRGEAWKTEIRFFTIALGAMVLYALGTFTPVFRLYYFGLPGVDLFRRPADATFYIGAMLSIVGGYLVHRLLACETTSLGAVRKWLPLAVFPSILLVGLAVAWHEHHLAEAAKPTLIAVICLCVAALCLGNLRRIKSWSPIAGLSLIAMVLTADFAISNGPNGATALPSDRYEFLNPNCKNETILFIKAALKQPLGSPRRDRIELNGLGFEWPNTGLIHNFDHVLGYNPLRLEAVTKAVGAGDSIAEWRNRRFTPLFPSYRSVLADMLGLRFIAVPIPIEQVDTRLRPGDLTLVARTKDAYIYENVRALPRAMFVSRWMTANFDELIETGRWPSNFDPRTTVLLNAPPIANAVNATSIRSLETVAMANVIMSIYRNTHVEIEVSAPQDGFVILNGVWHPWWRAAVDGKSTDILRANVLFRAVQVPAGRHKVQFDFEPFRGAFDQLRRFKARRTSAHVPTLHEPPT